MQYNYIEKRYNIMGISSIEAFASIKGGMNGNCKDVYFLRCIGVNDRFIKDIGSMDKAQTEKMQLGQGVYSRISAFPKSIVSEEVKAYTACYDRWVDSGRTLLFTGKLKDNQDVGKLLSTSCGKALDIYKGSNLKLNNSIEKNFVIKMLFWTDTLAFDFMKNWNPKQSMKFVAQGVQKEQEYLFCYLLTLMGIDVLLLQNNMDIDEKTDKLNLSQRFVLGEKKDIVIPAYDRQKYMNLSTNSNVNPINVRLVREETQNPPSRPKVVIPDSRREIREERALSSKVSHGRELEFEELALRAASVVMIAIHNNQGEIVGSGSGIMIGSDGYILTNNHVARGGLFYSVRIENDDTMYKTDEIIKYNSILDLAIIRIQRKLQPLPIYKGDKPLARGQRVVAIGSPLGLFNSVSNGIISGFRKINDVDMIQFTAPISHGSSGGAVLNMFGEVIGVSTAGFDDGQNINLAVGYEFINTFIRGFQ